MDRNKEMQVLKAILSGVYFCVENDLREEALAILSSYFEKNDSKVKVDKGVIERIREEIDLPKLIIQCIQLDPKTYFVGDCPFCNEGKGQFIVETHRYICGNCEAEGDAIQWCMMHHKMTFQETVKSLMKELEE